MRAKGARRTTREKRDGAPRAPRATPNRSRAGASADAPRPSPAPSPPTQVVWRFKYGKYKAMRAGRAGNCTACRLKRVFLAYRVLCDPCARESKMCPGCNKPPAQAELAEGEGEPEDEEGAGEESDSEDDLAELEAAGVVITRN